MHKDVHKIIDTQIAKRNDLPEYKIFQTKFPSNINHNRFGYMEYNQESKLATILEANGDYINIKCKNSKNDDLFFIHDKHDHSKQAISSCGNYIAFTRTDNGLETLCLYTIKNKILEEIDSRKGDFSLITFTNRDTLKYKHSSIQEGGNIYSYKIHSKKNTLLTQYKTDFNFPEVTKTHFGKIPSFVYKPECFSEQKKYPAIIFLHGGPCNPCSMQWVYYLMIMPASGFVTFMPNLRGNWGNGSNHLYEITGKSGVLDVDDVISLTKKIKEIPYIDSNNVHLVGESYGGYISSLVTTRASHLYKTSSFFAGVFDMFEFAKTRPDRWDDLPYRFHFGPFNEIEDIAKERSAINHVKSIDCPLFLLQGRNDPKVKYGQTEAFIQKLESNKKDFELFSNVKTHGTNPLENRYVWCSKFISFLEKNL